MGIKAYKCICEDATANVCLRRDGALKLIFALTDILYRNLGVDIYLDLAEKDPRVILEEDRFGGSLLGLFGIKDEKVQSYVFHKCKLLLQNEYTDDKKKKTIRALFQHLHGFDIKVEEPL